MTKAYFCSIRTMANVSMSTFQNDSSAASNFAFFRFCCEQLNDADTFRRFIADCPNVCSASFHSLYPSNSFCDARFFSLHPIFKLLYCHSFVKITLCASKGLEKRNKIEKPTQFDWKCYRNCNKNGVESVFDCDVDYDFTFSYFFSGRQRNATHFVAFH